MDIVTVKAGQVRSKISQRRTSERRHTTEVRSDQLPSHTLSEFERDSITSLSTEDLSPRGEAYRHTVADTHLTNGELYDAPVNSSWDHSDGYFHGSQGDLFQELSGFPGGGGEVETLGGAAHQYQLSYELALDNVLTPFVPLPAISPLALSTTKYKYKSHVNHVIDEMVSTEMTYVRDLSEVIEGYIMPLQMRTMTNQVQNIFGNISEIRDFHSSLLKRLNGCGTNVSQIGQCFLDKAEGFKTLYTQYCNNYPTSIRVLVQLSKQQDISRILKTCQQRLNHLLPLGAYLLKPVQRVLKYSLLLSEMVKTTGSTVYGYNIVQDAMVKMTEVASHINAMKKKYDTAVHVQEIQSLIRGAEIQSLDLTKFGDLVLEDTFRFFSGKGSTSTFRGRAERYVFLFQRLFLVTKKEEDGYQYKLHVEMRDMQLTERVEKEPNSFQIRQVSTGRASTYQARNYHQKDEWVMKIKVLLVESIPHLPDKARELIMRGFDVPRDRSPNRERHQGTDDPDSPSSGRVGWGSGRGHVEPSTAAKKSNSLGIHASPQQMRQYSNKHLRSRTIPSPMKLRGSLTGLLVSSIHQPSRSESPPDYDIKEEREMSNLFQMSRNGGHLDRVTTTTGGDLQDGGRLLTSTNRSSNVDTTPNHTHHISAPQIIDIQQFNRESPPSLDHVTHIVENGHVASPSPPHHSRQDGDLDEDNSSFHNHTYYDQDDNVTDEQEILFNKLMDSSLDQNTLSSKTSSEPYLNNSSLSPTPLSQSSVELNISLPREHANGQESTDDEGSTPRASPSSSPTSIRRWSMTKRLSYDINDPEDPMTPKASPYIQRHQSRHASSNHVPVSFDAPIALKSPILCPSDELGQDNLHRPTIQDTAIPDPTVQDTAIPDLVESEIRTGRGMSTAAPTSERKTLPPNMRLHSDSGSVHSIPDASSKSVTTPTMTSVKRSHSFGNSTKVYIGHRRDGSLSTDNSPLPSPIFKTKKNKRKDVRYRSPIPGMKRNHNSQSSPSLRPVAMMGLVSSTRAAPELEDIPVISIDSLASDRAGCRRSIILPPPAGFEGLDVDKDTMSEGIKEPEQVCPPSSDTTENEDKSLLSFFRLKPKKGSRSSTPNELNAEDRKLEPDNASPVPVTPTIPSVESNPNDMLSFDEMLQTYDQYATETGQTTRSARVVAETLANPSPPSSLPETKKTKKKKRHGHTVANIDEEVMKEVKKLAEKEKESRVRQLAREYSQKIKDRNRSRFSILFREVETTVTATELNKPDWLEQLKEKKRSRTQLFNAEYQDGGHRNFDNITSGNTVAYPHPQSNDIISSSHGMDQVDTRKKAHTLDRLESDHSELYTEEGDEKRGRFKGWVKSLAAKFVKKEGTTL